jgi:hypothetical protein
MRSLRTKTLIALTILTTAWCPVVVAEANPFKSTVSGDHTQLRALVAKSAKEGSKFKIIKFQVRLLWHSIRASYQLRKLFF